jgi:hypothetical protein
VTPRTHAEDEPWPLPFLRSQRDALEPQLLLALRAYDAIVRERVADTVTLGPIVRAACDPHVVVYENATGLLAHLTAEYEVARGAVTEMSKQRNWQSRLSALLSLGTTTPAEFSERIVRALLFDKSPHVREKAADQALRLGLRGLVDALREAILTESDATVLSGLEFSSAMLKDGYIVKRGAGDGVSVTVWTGNGAVGSWYSRSDFERRGLPDILSALGRAPMN